MKTIAQADALRLLVILLLVLGFSLSMVFVENMRSRHRHKQLQLEISYDALTEAKSRKFGVHYLERSFEEWKAASSGSSIAILVFDIDDFKSINDLSGHVEGDRVLKQVVQAVNRAIRQSDELFRLGGDEFVGVFHGVSAADGGHFAAKILDSVSAADYPIGSETLSLSISVGLTYFRPDDHDYTQALQRADRAMYMSKNQGGAQVTIVH